MGVLPGANWQPLVKKNTSRLPTSNSETIVVVVLFITNLKTKVIYQGKTGEVNSLHNTLPSEACVLTSLPYSPSLLIEEKEN
jgi:hypothetical protein